MREVSVLQAPPAQVKRRDWVVDLVRVASICMVVLGHWLAVIVTWENGRIAGDNALDVIPGLWPVTWVFQVMPLFFFVGGFANRKSYESVRRRGGGYSAYLYGRARRLLLPTTAFLVIGLTVATILDLAGIFAEAFEPASRVVTVPLWFLAVYLYVVALAPPMLALHRRYGWRAVAALAGAMIAVDLARFTVDVEAIGYFNYAFVWLFAHQFGFHYADGTLSRWGGAMAVLGLGALTGLVMLGPYPESLVGIDADAIDNMNPPTLPIAAITTCQIGVVMMARPALSRWVERPRVKAATLGLNRVVMTMFLWHLAAILPALAVLYPLGFPQPEPGTAPWYALRPAWIVLLVPFLAGLVLLFGRFEAKGYRPAAPELRSEQWGSVAIAAVGAVLAAWAVVGFGRLGLEPLYSDVQRDVLVFDVGSLRSAVRLAIAIWLLWAAPRPLRVWRVAAGAGTVIVAALVVGGIAGVPLLEANLAEVITLLVAGAVLFLAAVAPRARPTSNAISG